MQRKRVVVCLEKTRDFLSNEGENCREWGGSRELFEDLNGKLLGRTEEGAIVTGCTSEGDTRDYETCAGR